MEQLPPHPPNYHKHRVRTTFTLEKPALSFLPTLGVAEDVARLTNSQDQAALHLISLT